MYVTPNSHKKNTDTRTGKLAQENLATIQLHKMDKKCVKLSMSAISMATHNI